MDDLEPELQNVEEAEEDADELVKKPGHEDDLLDIDDIADEEDADEEEIKDEW